jgi:hypothetical protein
MSQEKFLTIDLLENQKFISITNNKINKKIEYPLGGSISILNKFPTLINFFNQILDIKEFGDEFGEWLWNVIHEYENAYVIDKQNQENEGNDVSEQHSNKYTVLFNNIEKIKYFVKEFYNKSEIDFTQFTSYSNLKDNNIKFDEGEIRKILEVSGYMKLYSLISYSTKKALGQSLHRKIYNNLINDLTETEIVDKIYNIVKTKTYRYNMTDRSMWEYLKNFQGKTIDAHIGETFNFLMNSILVFCEYDKNPITFMVIIINNNSRWVLHSIYVQNIQYEGQLSTEDIHTITSNNLKTYAYNEVLGHIKSLAYRKVHTLLKSYVSLDVDGYENNIDEDASNKIIDLNNNIERMTIHSPIHHCLTFPLLSKICDIPYYHMKTISASHSCILSLYLYRLLTERNLMPTRFFDFFELLKYGVIREPAVSTTFKIKYYEQFINLTNEFNDFYTFKSKIILHKIVCHFIGILTRNKNGYMNLYDGEIKHGFSVNKLEPSLLSFYVYFFAGQLDNEINKIRQIIYAEL